MRQVFSTERVGIVVEGYGVPHAHIHLIPINSSHDLKKPQDYDKEPDHEALAAIASRLRMQ